MLELLHVTHTHVNLIQTSILRETHQRAQGWGRGMYPDYYRWPLCCQHPWRGCSKEVSQQRNLGSLKRGGASSQHLVPIINIMKLIYWFDKCCLNNSRQVQCFVHQVIPAYNIILTTFQYSHWFPLGLRTVSQLCHRENHKCWNENAR